MEMFVMTALTARAAYVATLPHPSSMPNSKYSPYNIFVKERFKEIKENCPDIEKKEILKIITIEWKMKKDDF
tara:strand:- start:567 stop:782 length:216 start_codon:yes stop_codon:yes gene_type:complete